MAKIDAQESAHSKHLMREIFNYKVADGQSYVVLFAFTTQASVSWIGVGTKTTTTWSNFIVGYKANEIVVIPVSPALDAVGDPISLPATMVDHAKREITTGVYGLCPRGVKRKDKLILSVPSSSYKRGYQVMVDQGEEKAAFKEFFAGYRAAVEANS